jgi:predicted  nucleic acid-binding Zn-ribbon protein
MTSEQHARPTLADLEQKLFDASSRVNELQMRRQRLAAAANTGDSKARDQLDAANTAATSANAEVENLRAEIRRVKRGFFADVSDELRAAATDFRNAS